MHRAAKPARGWVHTTHTTNLRSAVPVRGHRHTTQPPRIAGRWWQALPAPLWRHQRRPACRRCHAATPPPLGHRHPVVGNSGQHIREPIPTASLLPGRQVSHIQAFNRAQPIQHTSARCVPCLLQHVLCVAVYTNAGFATKCSNCHQKSMQDQYLALYPGQLCRLIVPPADASWPWSAAVCGNGDGLCKWQVGNLAKHVSLPTCMCGGDDDDGDDDGSIPHVRHTTRASPCPPVPKLYPLWEAATGHHEAKWPFDPEHQQVALIWRGRHSSVHARD